MEKQQRVFIYAFLSRVFSDSVDASFLKELKNNPELLETIGFDTLEWIANNDSEALIKALNIDYTSMFVINTQPIESFVLDAKQETLVGLQNPIMQFYFENGYDVDMNQTSIMAPDHLSIELGFMQTLVMREEYQAQKEFMTKHLATWVIPYLLGMKAMADTPFYKELFDFIVEFLVADIDYLYKDAA